MARRCILGVFSHPDDETTVTAGTFIRYAREGVEIYVVTATRGEWGNLGTGGQTITREDLPAVREAELRANLKAYGVNPPLMLDYKDQELKDVDFTEHVGVILAEMKRVTPDVVITWGPTGISRHEDHIATSRAAEEAFHRYRATVETEPRLFYIALSKDLIEQLEFDLDGPEANPTTIIDITKEKRTKIQGLRNYRSQEDAQQVAAMMESSDWADAEMFHQAYPPVTNGEVSTGFWE